MKTKNYCKVIFCLFVLLQTGSFTFAAKKQKAPAMPEWVSSPATVYPSDRFLQYVGYASDRGNAEVQAINGLAAVFGQSVKSDSASSKRMVQAKSDGKIATASISAFSQDVLRSVNVDDLVGVEIKDYWFDGDKTWYAIAVLDKSKACDIYTDMIRKNARAIKDLLEKAEPDKFSIDGYAAYDFATDIAIENEGHVKKLAVIKPDAVQKLNVNVPSSKEISARKVEIAKEIPICVLISGDETGRIAAIFAEVISSFGFRGSLETGGRYLLTGNLSFEESQSSDKKTTRCRYSLETFILDTENDNQLCPFNLSGRDSHVKYEEAKNRALKSLEKKVRSDFKKSFGDYLKSL